MKGAIAIVFILVIWIILFYFILFYNDCKDYPADFIGPIKACDTIGGVSLTGDR